MNRLLGGCGRVALLVVLFVAAVPVWAQDDEYAGSFLEIPVGAKALRNLVQGDLIAIAPRR